MKKDNENDLNMVVIGSAKRWEWFNVPFNCGLDSEDFPTMVPPILPKLLIPYDSEETIKYTTNSEIVVFLTRKHVQGRKSISIYTKEENIKHLIGKAGKNLMLLKENIQKDFPDIKALTILPYHGDLVEYTHLDKKLRKAQFKINEPLEEPFNGIVISREGN